MLVRLSGFAALLALIVVVAGCGGGGSSSGGSTDAEAAGGELTKAEFIAEADASCTAYHEEAEPIRGEIEALEGASDPESPANVKKLGALLKETIVGAEAEMGEIRALEPPKADAATIDSMLAEAEAGNKIGLEAAEALEADDTATFGELAPEVEAVSKKAKTAAENYGLKVCGQEP